MPEVASAFVSLVPSARGFGSKLNKQIGPDAAAAGRKSGISFGKVFGVVAALGISAKVGGFLKDSIGEAREAQKVGAITSNVIKTTGGAAKVSAKDVGALATSISNKTGIDDEAIQSASNLLLTFTNLRNEVGKGNDVFNQATQLSTDLGAALGKDPKAASIQLGKALNDPVKGITALSRVGVSFDAGQKKQIKSMVKSGNVLGAQKIILGELKKEFGGTAAAAATSGEKSAVAFGNLKEQIGTALLPTVDRLQVLFATKVAPAISKFVSQIQSGEGAGGRFASALKNVYTFVSAVFGFIIANKETIGTFVGILLAVAAAVRIWAAFQALLNLALVANPIGLLIVAIAALVAGFVYAYKNSTKFRTIVNAAFGAIKRVVGGVLGFLTKAVPAAFNKVLSVIKTVVGAVLGFLKAHWPLILAIITGPLGLLILAVVKNKDKIVKLFRETWDKVSGAVRRGVSTVVGFVTKLPDRITGALGDIGGTLLGAGKDLIQGLIDGIVAKFKDLKGMLGKVTDLIPDWKGPPRRDAVLLRPAGQSIMGGLVGGITDGERDLQSTLRGVTNRIQVRAPRLEPSVSGATAGGVGGGTGRGGQEFRGTLGIDRDGVAYIRGISRDAVRAGNVARQAAARNQATGGADFRT